MFALTTRQWDSVGVASQLFALGLYNGVNVFTGINSFEPDKDATDYRMRLAAYRGGYVTGWVLRLFVVFYVGVEIAPVDVSGIVNASFPDPVAFIIIAVVAGVSTFLKDLFMG